MGRAYTSGPLVTKASRQKSVRILTEQLKRTVTLCVPLHSRSTAMQPGFSEKSQPALTDSAHFGLRTRRVKRTGFGTVTSKVTSVSAG